jgi:hypothetical protein
MSCTPTGRSPDLQRLSAAGYSIEIRSNHLLLHDVPYVNTAREICTGTVVTPLTLAGTVTTTPSDHVVHFIGAAPCSWQGVPLDGLQHAGASQLAPDLHVDRGFSNKPATPFCDYEQKMLHYVRLLTPHAQELDPAVTAKTWRVLRDDSDQSVFRYPDTASARAGITAMTAKLDAHRIGIVGAGGTGAHILDLLAKTSVARIDVFDGDHYLTHNALRAPGATPVDDLDGRPLKASYLCGKYDVMRAEIHPFDVHLTNVNLHLLDECTFVFVCIDSGSARRLIVDHLVSRGIPFIDCGLGMLVNDDQAAIFGTLRATLVTPERPDAVSYLSFGDDEPGDDVYASNIQVVELNALNAALAVLRFKQHVGFYVNLRDEAQWTLATSTRTTSGDARP